MGLFSRSQKKSDAENGKSTRRRLSQDELFLNAIALGVDCIYVKYLDSRLVANQIQAALKRTPANRHVRSYEVTHPGLGYGLRVELKNPSARRGRPRAEVIRTLQSVVRRRDIVS